MTLPGVWADVVGQDAQIEPLRTAVADPVAMTHAWLITGPPRLGPLPRGEGVRCGPFSAKGAVAGSAMRA